MLRQFRFCGRPHGVVSHRLKHIVPTHRDLARNGTAWNRHAPLVLSCDSSFYQPSIDHDLDVQVVLPIIADSRTLLTRSTGLHPQQDFADEIKITSKWARGINHAAQPAAGTPAPQPGKATR